MHQWASPLRVCMHAGGGPVHAPGRLGGEGRWCSADARERGGWHCAGQLEVTQCGPGRVAPWQALEPWHQHRLQLTWGATAGPGIAEPGQCPTYGAQTKSPACQGRLPTCVSVAIAPVCKLLPELAGDHTSSGPQGKFQRRQGRQHIVNKLRKNRSCHTLPLLVAGWPYSSHPQKALRAAATHPANEVDQLFPLVPLEVVVGNQERQVAFNRAAPHHIQLVRPAPLSRVKALSRPLTTAMRAGGT